MNRSVISWVAVILAAIYLPGAFGQDAPAAAAEAREVQVTAKRYEFSPNPITVKKGEHIKLVISAIDHDHGFKLDAFKINQELKKGKATTIEFTADQAGTFPFNSYFLSQTSS
jgi:cytochrome c oxidase subunit 2